MTGDRIGNYSDHNTRRRSISAFVAERNDFIYVNSLSTKTHGFKVYNHMFTLEEYTRHHAHTVEQLNKCIQMKRWRRWRDIRNKLQIMCTRRKRPTRGIWLCVINIDPNNGTSSHSTPIVE